MNVNERVNVVDEQTFGKGVLQSPSGLGMRAVEWILELTELTTIDERHFSLRSTR